MTDTPEHIKKIYREMIMSTSGEERLKMGCSMYDTAKEIVRANILQQNPNISQLELKKEIFLRFYSSDFSENEKEKIMKIMFS